MFQAHSLVEFGPDRFVAARRRGARDMVAPPGPGWAVPGVGDGVVAPLPGTAGEPGAVLRA